MKISKTGGITIFLGAAFILAAVILVHSNPNADQQQELIKKGVSVAVILASCIVFIKWYDKFTVLPVELWQSRHLIWKLAKNDFKKRYAGSYLGAFWAMAQPVVTGGMY